MNLLPHKSWHVWSKKNIDQVKKDEREAKEVEDRKRKREEELERDKKYKMLKMRAKGLKYEEEDSKEDSKPEEFEEEEYKPKEFNPEEYIGERTEIIPERGQRENSHFDNGMGVRIYNAKGHINFFEQLETNEQKEGGEILAEALAPSKKKKKKEVAENPEYAAEKHAEENRYTMFLGKGFGYEKDKPAPWYASGSSSEPKTIVERDKKMRAEIRKSKSDPLLVMNQFLSHTKKKKTEKKKEEKKKTEKKSIEDLRRDRMAREAQERERVQQILGTSQPPRSSSSSSLSSHSRSSSRHRR